jgi:hypothetical protein
MATDNDNPTVHVVGGAGRTVAALSLALAEGKSLNEVDIDLTDDAHCRFGPYTLVEFIGGGGMGVVYRAHQASLERDIALKLLNIGKGDNDEALERFRFEARSAAALNHPNIVQVLEVGQEQGIAFIAMQLVKGQSLAERIEGKRPSTAEAVALMRTLCDAVGYAHRLHLLHLDLKPANVLIDERGEPLVADFGLARRMNAQGEVQAQEVSGTPGYMAPEQLLIKEFRLSAATDIYALGAILYEMLCGVAPHGKGAAADVMQRALSGQVPRPRQIEARIPRDLEAICLKCLSLRAADRYVSVEALAEDLRHYVEGHAVSARPLNAAQRLRRWAQRKPAEAALLLCLTGGIVTTTNEMRSAWDAQAAAEHAQAIAEQQRQLAQSKSERLKQSMGLLASLFPNGDEKQITLQTRIDQVTQWLTRELPGQDQAQGEILQEFAGSLIAANKIDAVDSMMRGIVIKMGKNYRDDVVGALAKRGDPQSLLDAAIWAYASVPDPDRSSRFGELIRRAVDAAPNQALPLYVAALACAPAESTTPCAVPDVFVRLVAVEPDNGANWLLGMNNGADDDHYVGRAGIAPGYDDHFGELKAIYASAADRSGVPMPQALTMPALVYSQGDPPTQTIGLIESDGLPTQANQPLIVFCDPQNTLVRKQGFARNSCIRVGQLMAHAKGSLRANMVGSEILRRLLNGTDTEASMREIRRQYLWADAQMKAITFVQRRQSNDALLLRDFAEAGEFEGILRRLDRLGIPRQPPAVWVPQDPQSMLLPEERGRLPPLQDAHTGSKTN